VILYLFAGGYKCRLTTFHIRLARDVYYVLLSLLGFNVVPWANEYISYLAYKCQHDMAPEYLQVYCQPMSTVASRRLRSADSGRLAVPRTRTSYGDRSFAVQGPRSWNSLPAELRTSDFGLDMFRRKLKTFFV